MSHPPPVLDVVGLSVDLRRRGEGPLRLVSDISLTLSAAETVGVVGESGSGKSVTAMSIIRLLPPVLHIAEGSVRFKVTNSRRCPARAARGARQRSGCRIPDPQNSLDPSFTIESQGRDDARALGITRASSLTRDLATRSRGHPERRAPYPDYPHHCRAHGPTRDDRARHLLRNELLIADEPTTALDVTVAGADPFTPAVVAEEGNEPADDLARLGRHREMATDGREYAGEVVERGES